MQMEINLPSEEDASSHFLYFSFGSYMSTSHLHKFCPSATFLSIGRVNGVTIKFCGLSQTWKGAGSTMCDGGDGVWGVVWRVDNQYKVALDMQEAPLLERYGVTVELKNGEKLQCQAYHNMCKEEKVELPSALYLKTIVAGAREHGLPEDYIQNTFLSVKDNGYVGEPRTT